MRERILVTILSPACIFLATLYIYEQAERLRDFILKSNPFEGYFWRVHQIKIVVLLSLFGVLGLLTMLC
ncbi:hypothetical protein ERO13_A08G110601v2 [Gossypium hirsutum]|nr:hypothetical protein ERO13_A08G110601v2 [Gossypium hirsutum]